MKLTTTEIRKRLKELRHEYTKEFNRRAPHIHFLHESDIKMDKLWRHIKYYETLTSTHSRRS